MKRNACALGLLAALVASCGEARSSESGERDAGIREGDGESSSPSPLSQLGMMRSLLQGQGEGNGPYEEPRQSRNYERGEEHFALVELAEPVVELSSLSLFGSAGVELTSLLKTLRRLSADEQVQGLLLRLSGPALSFAAAEELRTALVAFKGEREDPRRVFCHAERAGAVAYYVLTACDRIGLAPLGEVTIPGAQATPIHIRELLDKLGATPQFTAIGDHKTAAEPLTRNRPSPELESALSDVLDVRHQSLVRAIAEGRDVSPRAARELIDGAIYQGEEADEAGLVDGVATFSAYREAALEGIAWRKERLEGAPSADDLDELLRLVGLVPKQRPQGERVAVVHLVGPVVEGEGRGATTPRGEIASRPVVSALRVLSEDESVKAVVARIDSPGGSALASEQIWLAFSELAEKKPLLVSMGRVAASGGYYIASPADSIFALDNTLTGSIGVVGGKVVIDEGLQKLGVSAHPMGRGERALLGSPVVLWDEDDVSLIRSKMRHTYDRFVDRVAAGRELSRDAVLEVAGGRLWTGAAAVEHGLVDRIGGFEDALEQARELGDVDASAPVEVYPPEPSLLDLVASMGGVSGPGQAAAGSATEMLAGAGLELRKLGLALPETRAAWDLLTLAASLYESPVATVAFPAAALR